MQYSDCWTN